MKETEKTSTKSTAAIGTTCLIIITGITLYLLQTETFSHTKMINNQRLSKLTTDDLKEKGYKDCISLNFEEPTHYGTRIQVFLQNTRLPRSFTMALPPDEASWVTRHIQEQGQWAPVESSIFYYLLQKYNTERDIVVDAGVNLGYFSLLSAAWGYSVIGFEPQLRIKPYLFTSAAVNPTLRSKLQIFPCALGSKYDHISMNEGEGVEWGVSSITSGGTNTVPLVMLQDIIVANKHIAILKVDTEGFEIGVFNGAKKLLETVNVANIIVEIKKQEDRLSLVQYFRRLGYSCRQYHEKYGETYDFDSMNGKPWTAQIIPCDIHGNDEEDFWFSKKDHDYV